MTVTIPTVHGSGSETFAYLGSVSAPVEATFMVIPTANGYVNKPGTLSVSSSTTSITGSSTQFTDVANGYNVGDYLYVGTDVRRVTAVANNTSMTVDGSFSSSNGSITHQKMFPAGLPINFATVTARTISTTSTTATFTLNETVNAVFQTSVYYDITRSNTPPLKKIINRNTYVKIQCNTHPNGSVGPWCLGMPDVLGLKGVWVDNTGGTYSTNNVNQTGSFSLDTGQRDSYYGLAYISASTPVSNNATLLIAVDN